MMTLETELQGLANGSLTNRVIRRLASLWFDRHSRLTTFFSPGRWSRNWDTLGVPQGILDLREFAKSLPDNNQSLADSQIRALYMLDVMRTYRSSNSTQDASSHSSKIYGVINDAVKDYPERFKNFSLQMQAQVKALDEQAKNAKREVLQLQANHQTALEAKKNALLKQWQKQPKKLSHHEKMDMLYLAGKISYTKSTALYSQLDELKTISDVMKQLSLPEKKEKELLQAFALKQAEKTITPTLEKQKNRAMALARLHAVVKDQVDEMQGKDIRSMRLQRVNIAWEIVRRKKDFFRMHDDGPVDLRTMWVPMVIDWVKKKNQAIQDAFVTAFEEAMSRGLEDQFFAKLCGAEGDCVKRVDAAIRYASTLWKDPGKPCQFVEVALPSIRSDESLMTPTSGSTPASDRATVSPSSTGSSNEDDGDWSPRNN